MGKLALIANLGRLSLVPMDKVLYKMPESAGAFGGGTRHTAWLEWKSELRCDVPSAASKDLLAGGLASLVFC